MKMILMFLAGVSATVFGSFEAVTAANAMLVNRITPPIIKQTAVMPSKNTLDTGRAEKVIKLYSGTGAVLREYSTREDKIETVPGAVRFKLDDGRTVIVGGSFSIEEFPSR